MSEGGDDDGGGDDGGDSHGSDYDGWDAPSRKRRRNKDDDFWPAPKPARPTKRPSNRCRACNYTWFPRGKSVSLRCPRCGKSNVVAETGGCCGPAFVAVLLIVVVPVTSALLYFLNYLLPSN
jgi:hypothetical protein